jgi:hypothetical protein
LALTSVFFFLNWILSFAHDCSKSFCFLPINVFFSSVILSINWNLQLTFSLFVNQIEIFSFSMQKKKRTKIKTLYFIMICAIYILFCRRNRYKLKKKKIYYILLETHLIVSVMLSNRLLFIMTSLFSLLCVSL